MCLSALVFLPIQMPLFYVLLFSLLWFGLVSPLILPRKTCTSLAAWSLQSLKVINPMNSGTQNCWGKSVSLFFYVTIHFTMVEFWFPQGNISGDRWVSKSSLVLQHRLSYIYFSSKALNYLCQAHFQKGFEMVYVKWFQE